MTFGGVEFHGFNSRQRKYIRKIFHKKVYDPLAFQDIKTGYFKLVSENYFRTIYPDIQYDSARSLYQLDLYGRPSNNFNISIGGAIATRNISQISLGLEYYFFDSYLLKNSIKFQAGTFYKTALLRSRLNLASFKQFYIEPELLYNHWDFLSGDDFIKNEDTPTVLIRTDRKYGLNIGFPFGTKLKAVAHVAWLNNEDQFASSTILTSSDTLEDLRLDGLKTGFYLTANTLNRKQYANDGMSLRVGFDYFNIDEAYEPGNRSMATASTGHHRWFRAKARWEQYFKKGTYSTGYELQAVFSNQPDFATTRATLINSPAYEPFQDSKTLLLERFRGHSFVAIGVKNVFSLRPNLDFRVEGHAFKAFKSFASERNSDTTFSNTRTVRMAATGGLTLHSPIGPINLSVNYYDDKENQLGVLLHAGFLLFNERALN